jgi:hypothetical protein
MQIPLNLPGDCAINPYFSDAGQMSGVRQECPVTGSARWAVSPLDFCVHLMLPESDYLRGVLKGALRASAAHGRPPARPATTRPAVRALPPAAHPSQTGGELRKRAPTPDPVRNHSEGLIGAVPYWDLDHSVRSVVNTRRSSTRRRPGWYGLATDGCGGVPDASRRHHRTNTDPVAHPDVRLVPTVADTADGWGVGGPCLL